jgi:dipeptidyl aminopeptidase/acylaminoacyl peptidase
MGARISTSFRRSLAVAAVGVLALSGCGGGGEVGDPGASPLPVRITAIREGAVAFARDFGGGPRVYLLNRDASGGSPLFAPGRAQGSPAWAPGGRIMAFDIGCGSSRAAVYVVAPYGRKRVDRAIPKDVDGCAPTWSPDGRMIAFEGIHEGQQDIWVSRDDGSAAHRLTDDAAIDSHPSWSPDGRRIVFVSNRGGNGDLYVMDADGSHVRVLYAGEFADVDPAWSPDGRWIAFSSAAEEGCAIEDDACSFHLWVVKADGSGARQITNEDGHDVDPTWSLDGARIAFASDRDGDFDIYVVGVEDGEVEQVTNDDGADRTPSWGERPSDA